MEPSGSYKRNPMLTRDLIQGLSQKPAVLVTGSKGKGSVACMLSQLLGTRKHVGLMTSPHLKEFRERFRVDGEMISEEKLVRILNRSLSASSKPFLKKNLSVRWVSRRHLHWFTLRNAGQI